MTRGFQTNTLRREFYTENKYKRSTQLQRTWIASVAIRVLNFHPTAKIDHPMIARNERSRLEDQEERGDDGEVMFIELIRKNDDSSEGEPEEEGSTTTEGVGAEYFDIFPSRSELAYHKVMDLNLSLGKFFLGEDVVVISSDKVEGSGDWNSTEFQDTTNSRQNKAMVFYQMDTEEVSDRFVAPCFVNGLEAYDGEINLGVEENMISNEYAVKLCWEHEVKRGNKVVKKELIVALRGEIYFVKFIINPEEDDVEPGVIFGRSFLRLTKAITDFEARIITIYPDIDPFMEETEEEGKSKDDWDHLLNFNIDDIPLLGEEGLPPFICKTGKSSRNKKRATENLNFFYQDIGIAKT
ncbi:hypothetical protein Tco_1377453 [Tanacetum coccineum]